MWWDVLRTGFILTLPGASQWRLQISACSAIGCLSVTSAMEISTLLTQLPVSSLEPYLILAVTRLKSMDSGRCRLAEAIPTQGRRTSCSLRLARTMNRMGCWASLVQSPPNSAETPNKPLLQVAKPARWLSANERPLLGYIDANGFVFAPNFLRPLNSSFDDQRDLTFGFSTCAVVTSVLFKTFLRSAVEGECGDGAVEMWGSETPGAVGT